MENKIQIKNRHGKLMFECDKHKDKHKDNINPLAYVISLAYKEGAKLSNVDLRGASLWGVYLQNAYLWGADLRNADLRNADLRNADLRNANLRGADLRGADLRGADLRNANLRGADLRGADLRNANLRGADLRGADLRNANLRGADLCDAKNAPLIINGLFWQVIIDGLGGMLIGCQKHKVEEWKSFTDDEISGFDEYALEFWSAHKQILLAFCDSYKHPAE